jgi:hypothetical protein
MMASPRRRLVAGSLVAMLFSIPDAAGPQEPARLELRKTLATREYRGRLVEGEEEVVQPGDTLWGILIQKRKLPEKRFGRYVALIRALNPHVADPDRLAVGERIFVPLVAEEVAAAPLAVERGEAEIYRVRPGDTLLKILLGRLGALGRDELARAAARVRALNPQKKNWDLLLVGEAIRLPAGERPEPPAAFGGAAPAAGDAAFWTRLADALGVEAARSGEELVASPEGEIRLDRALFPVFRAPRSGRRVIVDLAGTMPASLAAQLRASPDLGVLSLRGGLSLADAVREFLRGLGYQTLSPQQPLVIGDGGAALRVQGDWMFVAGEEGEIWVLVVSGDGERLAADLSEYLSARGVRWREIVRPDRGRAGGQRPRAAPSAPPAEIASLPPERVALVDELLRRWGATLRETREVSLSLGEGIRWSVRFDRVAETSTRKLGILFRAVHPELKKAFAQDGGWELVELPPALPPREAVGRLLAALGEKSAYAEHAFPVVKRDGVEKLTFVGRGFFLPRRSLFLTDGKIPPALERHLSESGVGLIYFR